MNLSRGTGKFIALRLYLSFYARFSVPPERAFFIPYHDEFKSQETKEIYYS